MAEAIGACHYEWDIGEIVHDYVETIETATGINIQLGGTRYSAPDIQARVRSPGIWLVANLKNALLLGHEQSAWRRRWVMPQMDWRCPVAGLSPLAGIDKGLAPAMAPLGRNRRASQFCIPSPRLRPVPTNRPPRQNSRPPKPASKPMRKI